jgi:hypothetical protein
MSPLSDLAQNTVDWMHFADLSVVNVVNCQRCLEASCDGREKLSLAQVPVVSWYWDPRGSKKGFYCFDNKRAFDPDIQIKKKSFTALYP